MRGREREERVLLSVVVVVAARVYKTGPGTPELISFTGPRVMRAGTAAKIAAATWLGKDDFM